MTKAKRVLRDKSGMGFPLILCIVLAVLILSTVVFEYMRLQLIAQGVRDSVQSSIIDVATQNWDYAYPGLREGYSGGYQLNGSNWYRNVNNGKVYQRVTDVLGLKYENGKYIKYAGSSVEYSVYGLSLDVQNAPLAPSSIYGITQLNVTGTIIVQVPLSFGWGHLPMMEITMRLKSSYVPKF